MSDGDRVQSQPTRADDRPEGIVVWGTGSHARVLWDALAREGLSIAALVDDDPSRKPWVEGVEVLAGLEGLERWLKLQPDDMAESLKSLVAIGDNKIRLAVQSRIETLGIAPYTTVHPSADIANAVAIGPGSQILAGVSVGVDAEIGRGCILFTGSSIDHHSRLGDGVYFAPGVTIAGHVVIEDRVMVGTGAVVIPHITLGADAVIGAGAVVIDDVAPGKTVVGNPARVIKSQ